MTERKDKFGRRAFSDVIDPETAKPSWPDQIRWLDQHAEGIALARQAGSKATFGFVLGDSGSQFDPEMGFNWNSPGSDGQPLLAVLLPHLNFARSIAKILALDARRGAELGDGLRVDSDLTAMIGLSRQLRTSDGFFVTQLVALGIDKIALDSLQRTLSTTPAVFSSDQLNGLAQLLAPPKVASDLINFQGERLFFDDIVQRVYTDNGHGSGRMTFRGMQMIPTISAVSGPSQGLSSWPAAQAIAPMISASRAELMEKYNQLMDQADANYHQPLRLVDWPATNAEIIRIETSPVERVRYLLLSVMFPSTGAGQTSCERCLGERDGTLAAIALELYHRERENYPAALTELVPQFLPEVPTDRITGEAVRYKLIDGKSVIYSVGADRIDDGGKPVDAKKFNNLSAADWSLKPADAPRGDWLLYPAEQRQ